MAKAPNPDVDELPLGAMDAAALVDAKKKRRAAVKRPDLLDDMAPSLAATAQVQADLLATASDLYRRIEADPHGLPDDEAYWTSLPAHLRTFIRNALPLGQLSPEKPDGPRHASTQAMIAVAQQLAQAAHASQAPLPGTDLLARNDKFLAPFAGDNDLVFVNEHEEEEEYASDDDKPVASDAAPAPKKKNRRKKKKAPRAAPVAPCVTTVSVNMS